ncbi:hypothetical protein [Kribbella catacumbae]|uniref:hypothetical protein n=1 Tax=Kribbella catacumbae TaxID=460086 RepID=UPI0012F87EA0|nr:hypothetical protein [Kribbella catacumbae]
MEQFAQRGIYLTPREKGSSYRLDTKGQKHRLRVLSRFSKEGTWQLDDWRREVEDDSYTIVVLVDFTEPNPLLFIIPADVWRADVREHSITDRESGHQAISRERVVQHLYRWSVVDA